MISLIISFESFESWWVNAAPAEAEADDEDEEEEEGDEDEEDDEDDEDDEDEKEEEFSAPTFTVVEAVVELIIF